MDYSESAGTTRESFQGTQVRLASAQSAPAATSGPLIPDYLQRTYRWAYLDARNAKYLDHEVVVKMILWRQHRRLEQAAFAEIESGQHVLQSACVYGNFSKALAEHIGPGGPARSRRRRRRAGQELPPQAGRIQTRPRSA